MKAYRPMKLSLRLLAALPAVLLFPILTPLPAEESLSPFGVGGDATSGKTVETWLPQMREIGIPWFRTVIYSAWKSVEKSPGEWDWQNLDRSIAFFEREGMQHGVLLWGHGFKDEKKGIPVKGLADWGRYVHNLATHLNGRSRWFEVWNEPPNGLGEGRTAGDYGRLVATTYDALQDVDRENKTGLTAKSAHVNFLKHAIRNGAGEKFDWISLHPYEILNGISANNGVELLYLHIVPTLRKMLADVAPSKVNVPVIFTELGSDASKGADNQAETLIKAYTMGIAQGVAQIQWFEGKDGDSGPMGLLDLKGNQRPSYHAYANMITHFGQHPQYLGWVLLNDRDYGFVFQGAKGTVLSTWAPKGQPDRVDFGRPVQIVEPLTGNIVTARTYDLTVSPVFVLDVPEKLVAEAKANKSKPIPWGGDFTNAKSVSVTFSENGKAIAKGLHPTSVDDIGKAVVLYGGAERAGSVPGGGGFIVDPNFLSYKTGPIEITAQVRRKDQAKPASIILTYEHDNPKDPVGQDPFKKVPPQEIPAGDGWTTLAWHLEDAEFNSYWGYNFNFNRGDYLVQSVTVAKVP